MGTMDATKDLLTLMESFLKDIQGDSSNLTNMDMLKQIDDQIDMYAKRGADPGLVANCQTISAEAKGIAQGFNDLNEKNRNGEMDPQRYDEAHKDLIKREMEL